MTKTREMRTATRPQDAARPGESDPSLPPSRDGRTRKLLTLTSVKHELADVVRGLRDGTIEPNKGRVLVYALSVLADVLKGADLEEKIRRLERRTEGEGDDDGAEGGSLDS